MSHLAAELADANATRLSKYNVLVILQTGCPDPCTGVGLTDAMVTDFVAMGGGVLLLPQLSLYNLTKQFGAALPAELMNESNASNVGSLSHMVRSLSRFDRPCRVADQKRHHSAGLPVVVHGHRAALAR